MIRRNALLAGLLAALAGCRDVPAPNDFGWPDGQGLSGTQDIGSAADAAAAASTCGNGDCDGDETLFSCPDDCSALAQRLAGPCATPGKPDDCPSGFACVQMSDAAGGATCVADYPTWSTLPLGRSAAEFAAQSELVADLRTGLRWAKQPLENLAWADAMTACAQQSWASRHDWRLPTRAELQTLADYSQLDAQRPGPLVEVLAWPATAREFWTAHRAAESTTHGLVVDFEHGAVGNRAVTALLAARCVSGGGE